MTEPFNPLTVLAAEWRGQADSEPQAVAAALLSCADQLDAEVRSGSTALDQIAKSLRHRKLHGRYLTEAIEDAVRATGRDTEPERHEQ